MDNETHSNVAVEDNVTKHQSQQSFCLRYGNLGPNYNEFFKPLALSSTALVFSMSSWRLPLTIASTERAATVSPATLRVVMSLG
jgi:hypothetical protein